MKEFKTVTGAVLMVVTNTEQEEYLLQLRDYKDIKRLEIVAEGDKMEMIATARVLNERHYFAGKWHYYLVYPAHYAKAMVAKY